jgi:HEAT repeat protein
VTGLARALSIRPGEGRLLGFVAAAFAAVEAGRGLGEVGVDTLILNRSGASALPPLYVGLGLVGLVVTLGYGALLARAGGDRFVPWLLLSFALLLGAERLLALSGLEAVYPALWISVYVVGALLVTVLWTVAGAAFHARQAKRLFPLCTGAAIAGSFVGLLAAGPVARLVGAENLVLAEALLIAVAAVLLSRVRIRLRPASRPGEPRPSMAATLGAGAAYVARSPLMRLIAIAYLLFAVLLFSVSYPFLGAMSAAFPTQAGLATALGVFSASVTAVSFLIAIAFANRVTARVGVATVALLLPVVYLAGFGAWLVRFTLATAIGVRFAQQVTQRGLSNAAWSSFFSVLPASRRGQVLAFIDGVPGQLGTIISGLLLMAAALLPSEAVFALGAITAAVCIVVVVRIRRSYGLSLVATLREGLGERVLEGGPGLAGLDRDPRVVAELRAATRAAHAGDRMFAAQLLGELRVGEAVEDLGRLLADDDRQVRIAAVGALAGTGTETGMPEWVERALGDEDAAVRGAALAAIAASGGRLAVPDSALERLRLDPSPSVRGLVAVATANSDDLAAARGIVEELLASPAGEDRSAGLLAIARLPGPSALTDPRPFLADPSPEVRTAAIAALAAKASIGAAHHAALDDLVHALDDVAMAVRAAAAAALGTDAEGRERIIGVLQTGSEEAQTAAVGGLDGNADEVHDPLVAWAIGQVGRATSLRRQGAALAVASPTTGEALASVSLLRLVLERRMAAIEARLLTALTVLGAPEAGSLIRRNLGSDDPQVRAQAIEGLDALGDRRLARAVVQLLDSEEDVRGNAGEDAGWAPRMLSRDPDPWVRALAIRTLAEQLTDERTQLLEHAQDDPDAVVRGALMGLEVGTRMPETRSMLTDIERMLLLCRVPLFAVLEPEDLQRVAAASTERGWEAGETLMTEGDPGDEMVSLVAGTVRVVHRDAGAERLIRTYAAGDHIGELAVLREGPRAATVVAEEPGVRGLVIGGLGLQAIVRERPAAAMAMLATLADRISQQ